MKFRKKPVVVEAAQWFLMGDHPAVTQFENGKGWVDTLEGGHIVTPGDWIITGVQGEHYPCKPDIFALTYESAEDTFNYAYKFQMYGRCTKCLKLAAEDHKCVPLGEHDINPSAGENDEQT